MRLIFLTPFLIGSMYGGIYHLTNRQVVLMRLKAVPYQLPIDTSTMRPNNNSRNKIYLRSPVLDAGRKKNPKKTLRKQVGLWTGI